MPDSSQISAAEAASLAIWFAATAPALPAAGSEPPLSPSEAALAQVAERPREEEASLSIEALPPLNVSSPDSVPVISSGPLATSALVDESSMAPVLSSTIGRATTGVATLMAGSALAARAPVPEVSATLPQLRLPALAISTVVSEPSPIDAYLLTEQLAAEQSLASAVHTGAEGAPAHSAGDAGIGAGDANGHAPATPVGDQVPAVPTPAISSTDPLIDFAARGVAIVDHCTRLLSTPKGVLLLMQTHMLELFVALLTFVLHISMTGLDTVVLAKLWFGAWVAFWILVSMRVVIVAHWVRATWSVVYPEETLDGSPTSPNNDFEIVWEGSTTSWLFIGISASFCLWYFLGIFCWTMSSVCRGLYCLLLGSNGLFLLLHSQMLTWHAAQPSSDNATEASKKGSDSPILLPTFMLGRSDALRLSLCAAGTPISSDKSDGKPEGARLGPLGTLEMPTCSVCLCDFEEGERVAQLPCGHLFHAECIRSWLQMRGHCPLRCEKPSAGLLALAPDDDLESAFVGAASISRETTDMMLELSIEDDLNNFTGSSGPEGVALRRMPSFLMSGGRLVGLASSVSAMAEQPRRMPSFRVSGGRLAAPTGAPRSTPEELS